LEWSAAPRSWDGSFPGWHRVEYRVPLFCISGAVSSLNLLHHGTLLECRLSYHSPGFQASCKICKKIKFPRPVGAVSVLNSNLVGITGLFPWRRYTGVFKTGRYSTGPAAALRYSTAICRPVFVVKKSKGVLCGRTRAGRHDQYSGLTV